MFNIKTLTIFFFLFSFQAFGDTLVLPEAFTILKVNGEKLKTFFFTSRRKVKLKKGPQEILLQYSDFYDLDFDDHEKVTSEPFLIRFEHLGGDVKTDFKRPDSLAEAMRFAKQPQLNLIGENQEKILINSPEKPIEPSKTFPKVDVTDNKETLTQLRYWWKKANHQEKQLFLKEIL